MGAEQESSGQEVAAQFLMLGAATVGESGGLVMDPRIKPVWPGASVSAAAFTVACSPGDNLAIHAAVTRATPGCVLVASVGDEPGRGYWGEVLTTAAESRGIAGLVIDGGVRDTTALASHRFPVFASLVCLKGTTKCEAGTVGTPMDVGGVAVATGDWIVGDADGVVVIPSACIGRVLAASRARAEKEERILSGLRGGMTTLELLGLDVSPIGGPLP